MDQDSTENPKAPGPRTTRRGSPPDLPRQDAATADIDPATAPTEDDDEALLPELPELASEAVPEGPLAIGHAAIEQAVRLAAASDRKSVVGGGEGRWTVGRGRRD